jgi:hypothetical protein
MLHMTMEYQGKAEFSACQQFFSTCANRGRGQPHSNEAERTALVAADGLAIPVTPVELMSEGYILEAGENSKEADERWAEDETVEVAHIHPGDKLAEGEQPFETGGGDQFARITTKAAKYVTAISFAAAAVPEPTHAGGHIGGDSSDQTSSSSSSSECTLTAAYPMQFLVRVDAARQRLVYDVHEAAPKMLQKRGDLPTHRERRRGEKVLGLGDHDLHRSAWGEEGEEDDEDDPTLDEPIQFREGFADPDGMERLKEQFMASCGHFLEGRQFRFAVPLDAVVGARLHCPAAAEASEHDDDDDDDWVTDDDDDENGGSDGGRAYSEERGDRHPAVLVLEIGAPLWRAAADPGGFSPFAVRRVMSARRVNNTWQRLETDWTPGSVASRASRHYIFGQRGELRELAAMLANTRRELAAMLAPPGAGAAAGITGLVVDIEDVRPSAAPPFRFATVEDMRAESTIAPASSLQALAARAMVASGATAKQVEGGGFPAAVVAQVAKAGEAAAAEVEASAAAEKLSAKDKLKASLALVGVDDPEARDRGWCLMRALLLGHYPMPQSREAWDETIFTGDCEECEEEVTCTLFEALQQSDYGGHDYCDGNDGGALLCVECSWGAYLTGMCSGSPEPTSGKFHHHCRECPDFGECIGDYRNEHCHACGEHFFAGMSGFACPSCNGKGKSAIDDEPPPASWPGFEEAVADGAKEETEMLRQRHRALGELTEGDIARNQRLLALALVGNGAAAESAGAELLANIGLGDGQNGKMAEEFAQMRSVLQQSDEAEPFSCREDPGGRQDPGCSQQ